MMYVYAVVKKQIKWSFGEDNTNNKKNIISKCKAVIKSRKIYLLLMVALFRVIRVNVIHIKNTTKKLFRNNM